MDHNKLYKLAKQFQKQSQLFSAQSGDIENVLKNANLWELSKAVAPLLNTAGVPDDASVTIQILVSAGTIIAYNTILDPTNPKVAVNLNNLLKAKFAIPMTNALKAARTNVTEIVSVDWLKF